MIFELLHAPFPEGYGEALLPLDACKAHLRLLDEDDDEDQDALIEALRDAAIEFVERYCEVRLGPVEGEVWRAERFPSSRSTPLKLGVSPVTGFTSIDWLDGAGEAVTGAAEDYRVSVNGDLLPKVGEAWPSDVGGEIVIRFSTGYAAGTAPRQLLAAARMFLGHLWSHREAVVDSGAKGEVPFGVRQLCASFQRVVI